MLTRHWRQRGFRYGAPLLLGVLAGCASPQQQSTPPPQAETVAHGPPAPTLSEQLVALQAEWQRTAAPDKVVAYENGIATLERRGVADRAVQAGQHAPDFTLRDQTGRLVKLRELLAAGPVVLTFYRGGWCPYCTTQLAAYEKIRPEIEARGATLVAITPELPNRAFGTAQRHNLGYRLLSDDHSRVARDYGLAYKIPPPVAAELAQHIDLEMYNGVGADELPLTATYVIASSGRVVFSYVDPDYRRRAEPAEILRILAALNNSSG